MLQYTFCLDHNSVNELLSSLQRGHVDGILVERYVAGAYYNKYKELGMELGTLIKFPYKMGMQAPSYITGHGKSCQKFRKCVLDILDEGEIATVGFSDALKITMKTKLTLITTDSSLSSKLLFIEVQ